MRIRSWYLGRTIVRSFLVLTLVLTPVVMIRAATAAQNIEESASPVDETIVDEVQEEPTEVPMEPEMVPTEESQEPVEPTEPEIVPTEEVVTETPPTEVPLLPTPTLAYDPQAPPSCLPISGDTIVAGGDLEYRCAYTISLDGANVDPASIALDWSVAASTGGDWSVQLLDPTGDPTAWTEVGLSSAALGFQTAYSYDTSTGPVESLQDVATIRFGLLLHRPVCTTDPVAIELTATGYAAIPVNDQAVVTSSTAQPLVATIDPVLAAIDTSLPTVSIVDIAVDPVAFSLTDTQTYGTLTIRVDNPALQCRPSNVSIAIQASAGSEISDAAYLSAVGSLDESTIAGASSDISGEGSPLDGFVIVSTLQNRAETGSYVQTIDFELTVPAAVAAGAYQLDASAIVEAAE